LTICYLLEKLSDRANMSFFFLLPLPQGIPPYKHTLCNSLQR
jgi:hypothetical protein